MALKKIIFILILASTSIKLLAQIQRTEPPFWYAGMKNSELQIMFYGKDIAKYEVTAPANVVIRNIMRTENPNYIFLTIDTQNLPPSEVSFTFKLEKKSFIKKYELKVRRENSATRESFNSSDLIYLLMPDRFANGNLKNDNTPDTKEKADRTKPGSRHGGDIEGIIKNLGYIEQLGASALWSTPLCEDNDARGSYHGYGQSDVYRIDPRYGTNEDYLRLVAELHKRDMKLIMDYVTNHWGDHWTFKDMPTYEWLHQFPGYAQTNYRMTTQFDPNASAIDTKMCTDGWFVKSMPDLNQSNPLMLNYLIQNAIWWIEYANLDGLRVDTYSYNDKVGIAKWTKAILDEYPNFNIAGEVWMNNHSQIAYWQKDSKIGALQSFNSYLPTVMDFPLQAALENTLDQEKQEWNKGMINIYDNFTSDFLYPDINNMLVFAENHDTQRFNQRYPDFRKYQIAMTIIATVRGIPQIYYGSEIGMQGDKATGGDADIRRDFPGGWPGDTNNAFTKAGRTPQQQQYYEFSSKLFNWRKTKKVIHTGKTTHYIPENNVYVYFRYNEQESVMVVINNSNQPHYIKTERFGENIGNYKTASEILSGKNINLSEPILIEPQSTLIFELK